MSWFNFDFGDFSKAFLSVLFEGIPFLLLGSLISGFVDVHVSTERVTRMMPRNPLAAIVAAALMGLVLPICECGSVVIIRRFLKKGLPLSVATSYMLAAPIVSPIVGYSTWMAFQNQQPGVMTASRLIMGFAVAVVVALVVHNLPHHRIAANPAPAAESKRRTGLSIAGDTSAEQPEGEPLDFAKITASASPLRKLLLSIQSATADFLDVAFYFIIGVAVTSVFATAIQREALAPLAESPVTSIMALMVFAALLALCSTTDAFVAAVQFTQFSAASNLAFLLFGPVFDLKLFWLYGLIFRRKFVILLGLGLFILIAILCMLWGSADFIPKRPTPVIGTILCNSAHSTV
jgi:uncharacterized protein